MRLKESPLNKHILMRTRMWQALTSAVSSSLYMSHISKVTWSRFPMQLIDWLNRAQDICLNLTQIIFQGSTRKYCTTLYIWKSPSLISDNFHMLLHTTYIMHTTLSAPTLLPKGFLLQDLKMRITYPSHPRAITIRQIKTRFSQNGEAQSGKYNQVKWMTNIWSRAK